MLLVLTLLLATLTGPVRLLYEEVTVFEVEEVEVEEMILVLGLALDDEELPDEDTNDDLVVVPLVNLTPEGTKLLVSDKFAPIRRKAIIAVTAFCQRRLTTYFFRLVLLNLVAAFTGALANHLCFKQSLGFKRRFGSLISSLDIKSLASAEIGSKESSSKS